MPIDPLTAVATGGAVTELAFGVIGDVINVIERVRSKALGEEEGVKLLTAARARLRTADASLVSMLADNDRYLDSLPPLPEPGPVLTPMPSPVLVPVAPPPAGAVTGPEPTGES